MARKLFVLVVSLAIVVPLFAALATPAGAYYNELEGYRSLPYAGSSNQGVFIQVFVMPWRRVQVYGEFQNGSSGAYANFTNWVEYWCDGVYHPYGCTYNIVIPARFAPWHPTGCLVFKKDDYGGQHGIIMECGTW